MESSTPQAPVYSIHRDVHGIPQFTPKRGTQALKDALIYSFPSLSTELELMQAALRQFFDSEKAGKRSSFICELPENNLQVSIAKEKEFDEFLSVSRPGSRLRSRRSILSSRASSRTSSRAPSRASSRAETSTPLELGGGGTMSTWCLSSGKELEKKKKGPYDAVKRKRVAENRGMACEKHRAAKTMCDPDNCPMNKLYRKERRMSEATTRSSIAGTPALCTDQPNQSKSLTAGPSLTPSITDTPTASSIDLDGIWDLQPAPMLMDLDSSTVVSSVSSNMWQPAQGIGALTWIHERGTEEQPSALKDLCPESDPRQPQHTPFLPPHEGGTAAMIVTDASASFDHTPLFPFLDPISQSSLLEDPNDFSSAGLLNLQDQNLLWSHPENTMAASDDPFMGWATKRASQVVEDYGWVLSHVGTL